MAHPFTPAEWLASFEKIGGAYAFTGERLHLWIIPGNQTNEDVSVARALCVEVSPDNRALLAEHLRSAELVEG